jgi:WD40 repeat protein
VRAQVAAHHAHVRPEHLRSLLEELLRLDRARRPHGGAHATLLGVGDASLVPSARGAPLQPWTRWPHTRAPLVHKLVRACVGMRAARALVPVFRPHSTRALTPNAPPRPVPQLLRETGGGWGAGAAPRRPVPSPRALALPPTLLGDALQRHRVLRGHRAAVYCAIFDAGGRRLITGSDDYLVKIWSAASGMLLRTCRGHEGEITYIAASADDTLAASASMDGTIRTWRLADGVPMAVLLGHTQPVTELAFHPAHAHAHLLLSVSTDDTVRLWDAARNAAPPLVLEPGVDEDALAGAGGAGGGAAGGGAAAAATTVAHVCCAFSPDGLLFAAGTRDFSAVIWRLDMPPPEEASGSASGGVPPRACVSVVDRLRGHRNEISFVQFAAAGDALLSGSKDGTVRVWRGPSGGGSGAASGAAAARSRRGGRAVREPRDPWVQQHVLAPPPAPPMPHQRRARAPPAVNMVRWSGDGRTIVAALDDASLCLWDAAGGTLLSRLRQHTREVFVVEPHPFDPRLVLTAGHDGHVFLWDVAARCIAAEWDLHGALPEDAMWLLDARWTPDGAGFVVSDGAGCVHLFGTGAGEARRGAKADQFFASDYGALLRDERGFVADLATNRPPHLARHELLCDYDPSAGMMAYGEPYQSAFQQGCVLIAGVPLDTQRLRDTRVRAPPPAPTPAAPAAGAAPAGDVAQRPLRRLFRMSGTHAGGGAGPSDARGAHVDAIELLSSSSSSSSDDDDFDDQDESDGGARRRQPRRVDRTYIGEDGEEAGSGEEDEEDGEEDGDGGGGAHGDDSDGDAGLRRSSRRLRAREEEERSRRAGLRARRAAGGGGSDALAAAQPAYATRFAGARRMRSLREESDSDDSDDEAARGRKRRRAASERGARAARHATRGGGVSGSDEGGGGRHQRQRDYREVSDDDSPRRAQRRERDRARRARDREKKEARRRQRDRDRERRRRRAGGLSDDEAAAAEDAADAADAAAAAGPSRYHVTAPAVGYRPADKFAWLQQTERRVGEYVPQLGDAVVYLAQGHKDYLASVSDALQAKPWVTIPGFRAAEPAVVTGLEYEIVKDKGDATVARMTLTLTDPAGGLRGERFQLELPDMTQEGSPDFIVEFVRAHPPSFAHAC